MRVALALSAAAVLVVACVGGGGPLPDQSGDTGKAERSPSGSESPENTGIEKPADPKDDDADAQSTQPARDASSG